MLGKLLKYDLKWIYKLVGIFYILAVIFAIIARIFSSIGNSPLAIFLAEFFSGLTIGMLVSALINTMMRSWVRLRRNLYGDEAYLTHTLPVEKKTLYLAKVLAAVLVALTTVLMAVISLFICYYSPENLETLRAALETTATFYDTSIFGLLLTMSVLIFAQLTFIVVAGYVGIILGHRSNLGKMAKSVGWGFGIYAMAQILTLVMVLILGALNPEIAGIISGGEMIGAETIKLLMGMAIIVYIIYTVVLYFVGQKCLDKGVDVD